MKRTLLTLASIALLVVSCGKESSEVADAPSAPKFITVEAQIGALTRATTTGNTTVFDEGLMIPQDGFRTVSITIDGKEYTYTHTEDIPLVSGKFTTLNLIVGREKIEIGEVSINDWTEGTTLDGGQAL